MELVPDVSVCLYYVACCSDWVCFLPELKPWVMLCIVPREINSNSVEMSVQNLTHANCFIDISYKGQTKLITNEQLFLYSENLCIAKSVIWPLNLSSKQPLVNSNTVHAEHLPHPQNEARPVQWSETGESYYPAHKCWFISNKPARMYSEICRHQKALVCI